MTADRLESRVWLIWGLCAMAPMLLSRHPLVVVELLAIVLAVRMVWAGRIVQGWGWIARVAFIFVLIGVIFNALTVHAGNQVLFSIPEGVPLIGGPVTLNAMAYGLVSGLAMLTLVLAGTTVAAGLRWSELVRSLPPRVAPIAVAGSVAWSFLPGASRAFGDIRESQASRGHRLRGARDIPQLAVPLIEGGLERALTMAEALEARGFGAAPEPHSSRRSEQWTLLAMVGGLIFGAYALAMGREVLALAGAVVVTVAGAVVVRSSRHTPARQRYRIVKWGTTDRIVAATSLVALVGFLWRQATAGASVTFNPYPELSLPSLDIAMVLSLALLLVPAAISPDGEASS